MSCFEMVLREGSGGFNLYIIIIMIIFVEYNLLFLTLSYDIIVEIY